MSYTIKDALLSRHSATDTICVTGYKLVDGKFKVNEIFCNGVDYAAKVIERSYQRKDIGAIWTNIQRLKAGSTARKKNDIESYTNLVIDIDRRDKKVGGEKVNATEEERKVLYNSAREVIAFLADFGQPVFADSGNGFHISWRIGDAADWSKGIPAEQGQELYKRLLVVLKQKFEHLDVNVEIDASVADPTQVVTVWGTFNRKYPNTPDRPQRQSQVLNMPGHLLLQKHAQPVTANTIEMFLAANEIKDQPKATAAQSIDKLQANAEWLENYGVEHLVEFFDEFIEFESDEYEKHGEIHYPIKPCPCHADEDLHDHSNENDCEIIVYPDGGIGIGCFSKDFGLKTVIAKLNEMKGEKYPYLIYADNEPSDEEIAKAFGVVTAEVVTPVGALCYEENCDCGKAHVLPQKPVELFEPEQNDAALVFPEDSMYGRAGELARKMRVPMGFAYPAIVTAFSVLPEYDTMLGTRLNLYCGLIGAVEAGKNVAITRALEFARIPKTGFARSPVGGDQQLTLLIGDRPGKKKGDPRTPGPARLLLVNNELTDVLKKTGIDNSTLGSRLCDLWDESQYQKHGERGFINVDCRLSWIGGIPADEKRAERFTELFSAETNYGLYSRFIFGYSGTHYDYVPADNPPPVVLTDDNAAGAFTNQLTHVKSMEPKAKKLLDGWQPKVEGKGRLRYNLMKWAVLTTAINHESIVTEECARKAIMFMEHQVAIRDKFKPSEADDRNREAQFAGKFVAALMDYKADCYEDKDGEKQWIFVSINRVVHDRKWLSKIDGSIVTRAIQNLHKFHQIAYEEYDSDGRPVGSKIRLLTDKPRKVVRHGEGTKLEVVEAKTV